MIKTITSKKIAKTIVATGILMLSSASVNAQISLTALNTPYTQDFNTLSTNTVTPTALAIPGWEMFEQGTSPDQLYLGSSGNLTGGNTYSFGSTGNTERAFGGLSSNSFIATIGSFYVNNTGATVNTLAISYTGEQWRSGDNTGPKDSLVFQYSLNATDLTTASGTWVFVPQLNFKSPITATTGSLDGNLPANQTIVSYMLSGLNIPDGATFRIRWTDPNITGTDDGLGIDDFSITPMFVNELSIADATMNEGNSGFTSFDFVVQLTAPAGVGGVGFELNSADITANQPGDYMQITNLFGTIPQGATSYTLTVPVYGDLMIEPDETFSIALSNVTPGITVTDAMAIGTIINDDYITPVVTLDPSDVAICHGSTANFFAAASGTPTPTVQWQVSTNGGTNWTDMPGQTFTNLQFTAQVADNGSIYRAVFFNGGYDTTLPAAINVHPNYYLNETVGVCPGSDYTFPDGSTANNITSQVVHVSNLVTVALGCDSVITTTVDVNPVYNVSENASVCIGGDFTYPDGTVHTNITADESYVSNMQTLLGCDSIITTNLTVNSIFPQITANSGNVVACGDVSADFGIVVDGNNNTYQWFYDEVGGSDFGLINGTYGESNFNTDTMSIQQLITNNYNGYYVYCEVTNEFGCVTRSENDTIVVYDLPTANYSSVVNAASVDFTDSSVDAVTYDWSFGDGNFSTTQSPTHTYTANGTYTVCLTVTSVNGCLDSVCSSVVIQEIGIRKLSQESFVSLFPNPAKDKLTVQFAAEMNVGKISLVNVLGQEVLSETKNSKMAKVEMNLSSVEAGVYNLVIENGTEKLVKKLIVE